MGLGRVIWRWVGFVWVSWFADLVFGWLDALLMCWLCTGFLCCFGVVEFVVVGVLGVLPSWWRGFGTLRFCFVRCGLVLVVVSYSFATFGFSWLWGCLGFGLIFGFG